MRKHPLLVVTLLLVACGAQNPPPPSGPSIPSGSIEGVKSTQLQIQSPTGETLGKITVDANGKTSALQLPAPTSAQLQAAQSLTVDALVPPEVLPATIQAQGTQMESCSVTAGTLPENLKVLPLKFVLSGTQMAFISSNGNTYLLMHSNLSTRIKATLKCTLPPITENLDLDLKNGWNVIEGQVKGSTLNLKTVSSLPGNILWTVKTDTTPPAVQWNVTPDVAVLPELVTIEAQVRDNIGVQKVELLKDGVLVKTFNGGPYLYEEGWQDNQQGKHTWQLRAFDHSGQVTEVTRTQDAKIQPLKLLLGTSNTPEGVKTAFHAMMRDVPSDTALELSLKGPQGWNKDQIWKGNFTLLAGHVGIGLSINTPPVSGNYTLEVRWADQMRTASASSTFPRTLPIPEATYSLNDLRNKLTAQFKPIPEAESYSWFFHSGSVNNTGEFYFRAFVASGSGPGPAVGPVTLPSSLRPGQAYHLEYIARQGNKLGVPIRDFAESSRTEVFTEPGGPRKAEATLIAFRQRDNQLMLSLQITARSTSGGKLDFALKGPAGWNNNQPMTNSVNLSAGRNLWWFSHQDLTPGEYQLDTTVDGVKESQGFHADFNLKLPQTQVQAFFTPDSKAAVVNWNRIGAAVYEVFLQDLKTNQTLVSQWVTDTWVSLDTTSKVQPGGRYRIFVRAWTFDFRSEEPRPAFAAASDSTVDLSVPVPLNLIEGTLQKVPAETSRVQLLDADGKLLAESSVQSTGVSA